MPGLARLDALGVLHHVTIFIHPSISRDRLEKGSGKVPRFPEAENSQITKAR